MLKSLRYRLLLWFVLSTLVLSVLAFSLFQIHKSSKANNLTVLNSLQFFKYQFLKDQNRIASFLSTDIYEPGFYMTGESSYLNEHYKLITNIDSCFVNCFSKNAETYKQLDESITAIQNSYANYCLVFDSLVYTIYQRGFQDYGLEGKLNGHMYSLEGSNLLPYSSLMHLKLSEKEYLHRYDISYSEPIHDICSNLKLYIQRNQKIPVSKQKALGVQIDSYLSTFEQIVELDQKLGLSSNKGLKHDLGKAGTKLESLINNSIVQSNKTFEAQMSRLNQLFGLSALLLVIISLVLSIYTSKYLVTHLEKLIAYISSLTKTNFNQKINIDLRHSTSEIRKIYKEFRNMLAELRIREKQRDLALRFAEENQQRYRDLSDLLPQSIYETDNIGNLTYVNEAWYKIFGYTKKDFVEGINLIEILNADPNGSLFGPSKVEDNDFLARCKDGSKFPVTVYSDIIKKGVRVIGHRGIIIDATIKQKYIESLKSETEKAITSDKHKSSFLANMSHEIRTPMNSIIGFSNMLSSKEIPEDQKESFIHHIQSSSEMLLTLVDDIIDVAKIEAGQLKIKKTDCTPRSLVTNLAANFVAYKERVEKQHIEVKLNLPQEEIPFRTDDFRLKQILTNLISNAIKFTEEGHIEIGLRQKNQRTLEFYVEDTGMGMSKEEQRTVFERYARTKLSEDKKISGTGLGLAISRSLIEMLNGTMWVTSEVGSGTKFSFELPYIRVMTPKTDLVEEQDSLPKIYDWSDKVVLIAEDDDNGFTCLQHILENTNATLVRAKNGIEVIEAMSFCEKVDIVLMDLQMPELNGLKATEKIKENYPKVPIIAQTAFAMEDDRNNCLKAGCDDYITKPLNPENLLAKMGQFISQNKPPVSLNSESTKWTNKEVRIQPSPKNN